MKSFVPVAGVDVSKRFSDLCVLSPDNNVLLRQKIYHDMVSMKLAEKKLHEIELEYGTRPVVVMESTSHYHLILFQFFTDAGFEVVVVNPIQSGALKNINVRKVKNDRVDAYRIAMLYRLKVLRPSQIPTSSLRGLRMEKRLKPSTLANKRFMIDLKITPFFGRMPLDEIKPTDIRRWQNELTGYRDDKGEPYSQTYLRVINNQITAIFNYAVKYYGLKENPCHKAGSMGKKSADEMLFWTRDEFTKFIEALKDRPASYAAFMTLYYTGMREGELLALTPADIDFEKSVIAISKSYQRLGDKDVITSPKTPKSNRVVTMPEVLSVCLKGYIEKCYGLQPDDRLFPYTKHFLYHEMEHGCKVSGVKRIRVHDIRHSHASLLVEMGCSPLLIAERLGHEKVQTTMDTYSHLYPNKQAEVARQLDAIAR